MSFVLLFTCSLQISQTRDFVLHLCSIWFLRIVGNGFFKVFNYSLVTCQTYFICVLSK
jgi:hypothetical protein